MKVCIIGGGFIGSTIVKALEEMEDIETVFILDKYEDRVKKLAEEFSKVSSTPDLASALGEVDLVIESATQNAVREHASTVLKKGKDLMVLSVGAFLDQDFWNECKHLAKENNCRIYIPSGAICGTDGLHAASVGRIDEVILISYKPPSALKDVEYLKRKGVDLDAIERAKVVFDGHAGDAVKHFPRNINVAATVSLTGEVFEKTRVRIVADPNIRRNIHRLIVKGEFGEIECNARNLPSKKNPRTSVLAALSAIATVKKIVGNVWVGA
ncbi:MAG: aspartate dehydrogenase [Methanobacteriota archaeon]|nr:MAG: aspartate dehydrogenase [Euryarchaeota archaeon]